MESRKDNINIYIINSTYVVTPTLFHIIRCVFSCLLNPIHFLKDCFLYRCGHIQSAAVLFFHQNGIESQNAF